MQTQSTSSDNTTYTTHQPNAVDTLSDMCVTTHSHTFPLALVVSLRWHVVGMMLFGLVDIL